jgi:putative drug exporter of the RND superfamily
LGEFVVHNPWKIVTGWGLAAVAIVRFAPSGSEVKNTDQANFLPGSYEAC